MSWALCPGHADAIVNKRGNTPVHFFGVDRGVAFPVRSREERKP